MSFLYSWTKFQALVGEMLSILAFSQMITVHFQKENNHNFFTRMTKFSFYHVFFWNFFLLDFFSCPPNICKARGSRKLSPSLCASSALSFACSFSSFRFALSSCILFSIILNNFRHVLHVLLNLSQPEMLSVQRSKGGGGRGGRKSASKGYPQSPTYPLLFFPSPVLVPSHQKGEPAKGYT